MGGRIQITGGLIQLYAVGAGGDGTASQPLISATVTTSDGTGDGSDSNANAGNGFNSFPAGSFRITGDYTCPTPSTEVYLTAIGGNPGRSSDNPNISLVAFLGECGTLSASTNVIINEITMIGSLAPIASYATSYSSIASGTSDQTPFDDALAEVAEYTNTANGTVPGPSLPPGYYASSLEIQTLGDIVAECINSAGGKAGDNSNCGNLFTAATPANGTAPTDTVGAILNILNNPSDEAGLFGLLTANGPFQPTLTSAPSSWALPILPVAATPVITPGTGSYTGAQEVAITDSTPYSTIYYTTNGSTPTTSSTVYDGSFEVAASGTVSAIAVAAEYGTSAVGTATYTLASAGTAAKLAFVGQPMNTATGIAITPAVAVAIEDMNGDIVSSATSPVTLAIGSNPGTGVLSGTLTEAPVNGIATFSNLSINQIANGYTLAASSSPLVSATSSAFNITTYPISISLPDPLVGVGGTALTGTFTLSQPAPAGGVTVNLSSSNTNYVTVSPSSVALAQGQTTGSFTYAGVASGSTTISAAATGYLTATTPVTATTSFISLGTLPAVSLGQNSSLALSLGSVAPAGGVTVSFTSSNSAVATVTPTVFIPAGSRIGAENPQITGTGFGSTTITASTPNFAPDVRTVMVSLTAGLSGISLPLSTTPTNSTLTISAPAPVGGLTFTLGSANTAIATVPSTVTIAAGATSASVPVTGIANGSTTISASYPGVTTATASINVNGTINFNPGGSLVTGSGLTQTGSHGVQGDGNYFNLGAAPPSPVTITLTIGNPAVATLASGVSSPAENTGVPTLTFSSNTGYMSFNIQGQSAGTTTLTASAPGYASTNLTVTVNPSGLSLCGNGTFSTNTFTNQTITVGTTMLVAGTLVTTGTCGSLPLNPGLTPSIAINSSNSAVGTISNSPAIFSAGSAQASVTFTPQGAGTSTISQGAEPAGFSTPSQANQLSGTATVTAPSVNFYGSPYITGVGLTSTDSGSTAMYLGATPPSPVTVTLTSANPAILLIEANNTNTVASTLTFPNNGAGGMYFNIQGQSAGTTTLTASAPGFTSTTVTVYVYPSGIVFLNNSQNLTTTTLSSPSTVTAIMALLNPGTLSIYANCQNAQCSLNAGTSETIAVTSSNAAVGTITTSPITLPAGGDQASTTFQPTGAGTTTVALGAQPAGLTATSGTGSLSGTATVTAPGIAFARCGCAGNYGTGVGQSYNNSYGNDATVQLAAANSNNPVTVTLTSSNPSVVTLGTGNTASTPGTSFVTFNNISTTAALPFNLQGQSAGTSTLTVSAPGYTSATFGVTVTTGGFGFCGGAGSFSTTTFSSPTTLTVKTVTGTGCNNLPLNPGTGPFTIAVTSSDTSVGTISGPVTFAAGSNSATTTFQPLTAGTSTISMGAMPAGFTAPTGTTLSGTATVTAPTINTGYPSLGSSNSFPTGVGLIISGNASFSVAPPSAETVTVTSSSPSIALVSTSASAVGSTSIVFNNVTAIPQFYIQGESVGTTTLTVSASGYTNATLAVTVNPSGFVFYNNSATINTTHTSSASTITLMPALLNPGTLTVLSYCNNGYNCYVNPGTSPSIAVTSSATAVGTIGTSPVIFAGGSQSGTTTFQPLSSGTSTIMLGPQPSGFTATTSSGTYLSGTATVQ